MTRRIVTAREQADLRAPWRTAMPAPDAWDNDLQSSMSADDRNWHGPVGPGPWYHGSDYSLPDGTELVPGGGRSRWKSMYEDPSGGMQNRPDWVWVGNSPDEAQAWGTHVYEVEPHGEGPWPWNGGSKGDEGFVAPRATIRQRVDMSKRRFEQLQQEKQRVGRVTIPYIRNNNGVRAGWGESDFGQGFEPWGRYMTQIDSHSQHPLREGWEQGVVDFDNPHYMDHDYGNWKQRLSEEYGGATGQALSDALLAAGHDGVVTSDKYGPNEFVDIRPKDQRGHRVMAARPTAMADYDEYAGSHRAPGPDSGFPVIDMTGGSSDGDLGGVPEDWYTHPHYYSHGEVSQADTRAVQKLYNDMRGKPDHMVDIYRALPHGNTQFNTGDWVTPSLEYARQHAAQDDDPANDWPVIRTQVPAGDLWQNGDSYYEWGYHGPGGAGRVVDR